MRAVRARDRRPTCHLAYPQLPKAAGMQEILNIILATEGTDAVDAREILGALAERATAA